MAGQDERDPRIPWRVTAIASGLLLLFAAGIWWLSGPTGDEDAGGSAGDDTTLQGQQQSPGTGTAGDDEAPAGAETEIPGDVEPGDDAAGAATGDTPDPDAARQAAAVDEDEPASLAALAPARAVRGSMEVELFLVRPGLERLVPVTVEVDAPNTLAGQVERAVEELIAWEAEQNVSPLPPRTVIHEVFVSPAGIAYVDFAGSLPDALGGGSLAELHAVYGVVASITESFPEIRAVQILVDHEEIDTLTGHVDTSWPLTPSSEWVIRERRGSRRPR